MQFKYKTNEQNNSIIEFSKKKKATLVQYTIADTIIC